METLQRTANRGSISTGYDINNSLKLEADNSENLYRDLNASTSTTKFTHSMWVKRTELTNAQLLYMRGVAGNESTLLRFSNESGYEHGLQIDIGAGGTNARSVTSRKFRDTNAWYHFVLAVDTTQSTAANRRRLYVNGVEETVFGMNNTPSQDFAMEVSSAKHRYGAYNDTDNFAPLSGYIAECHYVDGSQLDASSFGEFDEDSGIWKPKQYTGSYGTGGYYLKFNDSSALGNNSAGDGTDFTLRNIAAADQATDSPTNNFCTFNVLVQTDNKPTINEGAMHVAGGGGNWNNAYGSLGVQNGKWYYEYKVTSTEFGFFGASTFPDTSDDATSIQFMYDQSFTIGYAAAHYYQRINGTQISNESTGWGTTSANDIYGLFLNVDDQEFTVARNGSVLSGTLSQPVSFNSAFSGHFVFPCNAQYEDDGGEFNFGGYTLISNTKSYSDANGYGNFVYSPVLSGVNYYAICTKNIAEFG